MLATTSVSIGAALTACGGMSGSTTTTSMAAKGSLPEQTTLPPVSECKTGRVSVTEFAGRAAAPVCLRVGGEVVVSLQKDVELHVAPSAADQSILVETSTAAVKGMLTGWFRAIAPGVGRVAWPEDLCAAVKAEGGSKTPCSLPIINDFLIVEVVEG